MTINTEIVSARYDLRDEDETQYSDAMLLNFFNRALKVLDSYLAGLKSDWVLSFLARSLPSGENSLALPDDFSTPRRVMIDTTDLLTKEEAIDVLETQQEGLTGDPSYYAIHKTNLIFERSPTATLTINIYYNLKSTVLVLDAEMPFEDEFNDSLRSAVVMIAKSRNNRDIIQDHALYKFFQESEARKRLKRSYAPKPKTDY